MALAMWLGALIVVELDLIRTAIGQDGEVAFDLMRSLPRWLVALPLVCAAWGALGQALAARVEKRWGARRAGLCLEAWLALPLLACLPPLFSGPAIRESPWRWPGLVLGALLVFAALAALRRALDLLANTRAAAKVKWIVPVAVLTVLGIASSATLHVLRGLYPAFHLMLTYGAVVAVGLCVQLALRLRPPRPRRAPGAVVLTVLAAVSWVLGGFLALPACMGRLVLIENAPLLGAVVGPAHALDLELFTVLEDRAPVGVVRKAEYDRLGPIGNARRNVLLVTIDALRGDAVEPQGAVGRCMPRVAALARRVVSYPRAYAPSNETMLSVIGLLSGRTQLPQDGAAARTELLPDAFRRAGWGTYAWFTGHDMPTVRSYLYPLRQSGFGFQAYRGELRGASEVLQWAAQRLSARPSFVWVHLSDVHSPFLVSFKQPTRLPGCEAPFLQQHASLDTVVSDALQAMSARDPSMVWALSADHGEARGERGAYGHGSNLHDEQVRVPLLVGGAGLAPAAPGEARSLFDLGSTLLHTASREPTASTPAWPVASPRHPALLVSRRECALVEGSFKLIADPEHGTLALYDLERDPNEHENLVAREPARARELLRSLPEQGCPHPGLERLEPR